MEDKLLLETIERYLGGTMLAEEKAWFEQLRKNTPEIDQMVVEHRIFLHQIEEFGMVQKIKHTLHNTHKTLVEKADINEGGSVSTRGRVVQFYNKYKKVTAIAASIAGLTALVISGLVAYFSPAVNNDQIELLGKKIEQVTRTQQAQGARLNEVDSKIPKDATVTAGGTAFMIDGKGFLITNAHVVKGSGTIVVNRNGQEFNAKIINIDHERDLAILKIQDEDFKPLGNLPYGIKKSSVDLGEELYTLGYPREEIVYSMGYLSAQSGRDGDTSSCQISLSANPGNSGGPVFNKNGEIVGIISKKETKAEGVVYAIKSKGIFKMIDELKESDTSVQKIKLPSSSKLKGMGRTDQVKEVEDFVFQVKAYQN